MANKIIELQVEGMDCANCAASITRFLERKGLEEVYVNFQTKEVRYLENEELLTSEQVKEGIQKLGYTVVEEDTQRSWWTLTRKLLFGAFFTAPLLIAHLLMSVGVHVGPLHNPWVQFALCLPVFILGFWHFGRSAWSSVRGGVPNMDVLIFIGGTAAFVYSLIGAVLQQPNFIFFETSATIFTLVLLGNWIEHRAVEQTTTAIGELTQLQAVKARRIMPSGTIVTVEQEEIKPGFVLQVNEGDQVPADGKIIAGEVTVDESMLTGESLPLRREMGQSVVGGSLVVQGNIQLEVSAVGRSSILGQMIELVKTAQQDKPNIQRLADRISAVFVPVVLSIAVLTFAIGHWGLDWTARQALMNAIAVLVISCPCAMGLATPTAVMVGVGRLARNGILIKGGQTVEVLSQIRQMVFDKTGTLTTGKFRIADLAIKQGSHAEITGLLYHLEKHSSHPIAKAIVENLASQVNGSSIEWKKVWEEKGVGVMGVDQAGNEYQLGSARILDEPSEEKGENSVFLTRNGELLASLHLQDELKPDAAAALTYLREHHVTPIILSGDHQEKTAAIAAELGVTEFYAGQLPQQKLSIIERLSQEAPTAMVGDGINDAPALARATLGISLSNASQAAIQSAQVVLLNGKLEHLPRALAISQATVQTIRQSLFWAFAYNIVAIPIAAMGYLNPMWGALFMAFSDVVVIGNAIRLRTRRIPGVPAR